jgi:two-component system cell cycle response regulator
MGMDSHTLEIPAPEKHAPATTRFLHVVRGPLAGQTLAIPDSGAVLGRGDDADLQLMDDGLSRCHARVEAAGDALRITDLGSRNGTFVHGSRIREPVLVYSGELIHVGRIVLRVGRATDLDGAVAEDLYEAATRDPLTGLYNRQYFEDRLRVEFAFARRHRTDLAILVLNVDRFAYVNETFGRAVGDSLLRATAVKLMGTTRVEDVVARYTGDTFIVVARNTNAQGAEVLAQRLRTRIATAPSGPRRGPPGITVSGGIAVRSKEQPYATAAALVDAAFDAMRLAKRSGGDRAILHLAPVQSTASTVTTYNLGTTSERVEFFGAAR